MVEEISEEEFEKMEDVDKEIKVFDNAADKVRKYNSYDKKCNGGRYNSAYHKVLHARGNQLCLIDRDGNIDESSLGIVEEALRAFDMNAHGQMGSQFREKLREKLCRNDSRIFLRQFRALTILSSDIEKNEYESEKLFNILSTNENGLDARGRRFRVGATKIMNFLLPEFFVIADKWVRQGLHKTGYLTFPKYWSIMMICRRELMNGQRKHGTLESLIRLDTQPTTLIRIFDKCAFVMGRFRSKA